MRWLQLAFLAAWLASPSIVLGVDLKKVHIVSRVGSAKTATASHKFVLGGQEVELFCVIKARVDGKTVFFTEAERVKGIPGGQIRRWSRDEHGEIEIEWLKVEPYMRHHALEGHDPQAPWFTWYANAHVPGTPSNPKWMGYDTLEYKESGIDAAASSWSIQADAHPTDPEHDLNGGLGTMRFKVLVRHGGEVLSSPGMESKKSYGISKKVHLISFRRDDSFLGWVTSYYNVPGIYGSSIVQVESYIGVDCSDLLTSAYMRATGKQLEYTSAGGLLKDVNVIEGFQYFFEDGRIRATADETDEPRTIAFGQGGIREGDLIFFCYSPNTEKGTCKRWHHVAAIYEDAGADGPPDGVLGARDLILHAGPREPHLSTLEDVASADEDPTAILVGRWR
jgi:hypothetical protein